MSSRELSEQERVYCARDGGSDIIEDELWPAVSQRRIFVKVLLKRKIVIVGLVLVMANIFMAVFAERIAPYRPFDQDLKNVLAGPGLVHLLGTDALGRDLLTRVIYGTRVALSVGLATVALAAAIGTVIGLVAGFLGGLVQSVVMRLTDALMAIPSLILAILIVGVLGGGVRGVVIAIGVTLVPGYARLVNGQVLSVKQNDYVVASRVMGANKVHMMLKHVLPNCLSPLIVQMTMMMGLAILIEASLSFLGLGVLPPTAAWGSMSYEGYQYLMTRPLLSLIPGVAIMILVFGLNMLGDGLRDALDPRLRGAGI